MGSRSPVTVAADPGETEYLAEVLVQVGNTEPDKFALSQGEYLIGRDSSCHVAINADGLSRHHARITFSGFELLLEDLGSSNGTFIDGVMVQLATRLYPDQEVQIGSARLKVRLNDAAARQLADSLWDADLGLAPVRQQLEGHRYRAMTTVARGGMGVILQARDLRIRRNVAMKVMKTGAQFARESVLRFIDEAQLTGQLEHPNIVPVYELGIDEQGEAFYTMKFVKGITLDEVIRGLRQKRPEIVAKYPLASLITIFQKICDGVAFAHSKGVVHRDLKPENVMIGDFGEVLVMDWGLAKQAAAANRPENRVETTLENKTHDAHRGFETMNGVVIGTPPYVSPEQARGELEFVDARSDIYVLGGILYTILTLQLPVVADTVETMLEGIIHGTIKKPSVYNRRPKRPTPEEVAHGYYPLVHCPGYRVPEGLSAIAMKALSLDPTDRYTTVEELQEDITAFQGGYAPTAERAGALRKVFLFAVRNRKEVAWFSTFAIITQLLLVAFLFQMRRQRNEAQDNEIRARHSEIELARAIEALRGTAPTFAQEARSLLEDRKLEEALDKIDYAIEQVPNEAGYHALRGNILQTLLRFSESTDAYEEALRRNPKITGVEPNLRLNQKLAERLSKSTDGRIPSTLLEDLHAALIKQGRVGEALAIGDQLGTSRKRLNAAWSTAFERRGMKQRFEVRDDDTLYFDLSKMPNPDLRKLRDAPVSGVVLDDTRVADLSPLRGLPLRSLSLSHTPVRDLGPLVNMPLTSLNLADTPVMSLEPLQAMPLRTLWLSGTRVTDLKPLSRSKIEQLYLSGCRSLRDLTPLGGMPLEKLDLSRTEVFDLTALVRSPLRELNLEGCTDLVDLEPLLQIASLEAVIIPAQCKKVDFLREHPGLKRLSYKRMTQPVYEFWAEYDAKKKGG